MKNIKIVLVIVGAALLGGVSVVTFLSDGEPTEKREVLHVSSAERRMPDAKRGKDRQMRRKTKANRPKTAKSTVPIKRERPKFEIGQSDEETLNELQRKLLEDIRAALRNDDYKALMRYVHRMQSSDEWPDGIPNSIKKAALEALGWYGSKCLPEIVPFLADANPEIVAEAVSQWEDAIAECDSDRDVAAQVKLAARVVVESDSVESILMETQNMRHSVAVETFKDVLDNGNDAARAKVLEQIADYTDDATIKTAEQLDEWLKNNPDDPGDEEMYGGIDDTADDD